MIRYKIDITEGDCPSKEGSVSGPEELKDLLCPDGGFLSFCGYLYTGAAADVSLCVAAVREHGVFLGYRKRGNPSLERLSLRDGTQLSRRVEVLGDGLDLSQGLFLSPELAWEGIAEFVRSGGMHREINWIAPGELPLDGSYLI